MIKVSMIVMLVTTGFLTGPVEAREIYKCVENGRVTYTQAPCTDDAAPLDLGPNAEIAVGAREQAMQREIDRLRADVTRMQREQRYAPAPAPQQFGRSQADLQAEMARSPACRRATRSYEISANSIRQDDLEMRRRAMYAACGMREPDDTGTRIIIR